MPNNVISKITLPNGGGTYDIKDAWAREAIAALEGGSYFLGVSLTPITDIPNNPDRDPRISIDSGNEEVDVMATNGNMAIYGKSEFVYSGTPDGFYKAHSAGDDLWWWEYIEDPISNVKWGCSLIAYEVDEDGPGAFPSPEQTRVGNYGNESDNTVYLYVKKNCKWVEFGDLSALGDLAYHDRIVVTANTDASHTANAITSIAIGTQPTIRPILSDDSEGSDLEVEIPKGVSSAYLNSGGVSFGGTTYSSLSVPSNSTPSLQSVVPSNGTYADTWDFKMGITPGTEETLIISGDNGNIASGINCVGGVSSINKETAYTTGITGSVGTQVNVVLSKQYLTASASGTALSTPSTANVLRSNTTFTATATDNS